MAHTLEQLVARRNLLVGRETKDNGKIVAKLDRKIRKLQVEQK